MQVLRSTSLVTANTRRLPNDVELLVRCLRHWPNIRTTLGERLGLL